MNIIYSRNKIFIAPKMKAAFIMPNCQLIIRAHSKVEAGGLGGGGYSVSD